MGIGDNRFLELVLAARTSGTDDVAEGIFQSFDPAFDGTRFLFVEEGFSVRDEELKVTELRLVDGWIVNSVTMPFQTVNQSWLAAE